MEYVIVRAIHPTWLTMQLPLEVAELIRFQPGEKGSPESSRAISFLSRGPGLVRVIATHPAREALAVETVRGRLLATARPGERHIFSVPTAVLRHLNVQVYSRGPRAGRGTDDRTIWFVPAPEYYEYRSVVESGKSWTGPANAPFAHVYVAKSLFPFPREFTQLAELELRIEDEEWRPGIEALQKVGRGRKVVL